MNKIPKIIAFNLSALSTMMLCVSVQAWASDIEIYQAPKTGDGKATVMLVLDNASIMHQGTASAGGGKPMDYDFGSICQASKAKQLSDSFVAKDGVTYLYNSYYCDVSLSNLNSNNVNAPAIRKACYEQRDASNVLTGYRCFDRFSMLKKSLFTAIDALTDNIAIGLNFSPSFDASGQPLSPIAPLFLTNTNKHILMTRIAGVQPGVTNTGGKVEPIAQGYGAGTRALIEPVVNNTDQCTGYGVYQLTGGTPFQDNLTDARTNVQSILTSPTSLTTTNCPDGGSGSSSSKGESWACVAAAAKLLVADNGTKLLLPVKTAVVGFGAEFSFSGFPVYSSTTSTDVVKDAATALLQQKNADSTLILNEQNAAYTGIYGQGGYYAASSGTEIVTSINNFINLVKKVIIPSLTTGSVTIPQDPFNAAVVGSQAYYPQFKPTPDQTYQLWAGNLKKYTVTVNGKLVDKYNTFIFDAAGGLVPNYDLWSPAVTLSDETLPETVQGSKLFALMGGVKSQLPVGAIVKDGVAVAKRKLLTNRNEDGTENTAALKKIDLSYLDSADPSRGYLISLLGYVVDATQPQNIKASLSTAPELRQVGAVMHSSPLLFTNKGTIDYVTGTATNREDYVLFGTTQGLLHVVDAVTGQEKFAFVPNEMVNTQKEAFLKFDSTSGGVNNLFYGIDAPWVAYTQYVQDVDGNLTVGDGKNSAVGKQLLYGGLRMGGRSYYSLNLQDINDPKLNFHINPDAAVEGSPLSYMGQSWSKPKLAWVNWNKQRKLVMFVGGGYDATGGSDGKGYENDSYDQTNGKGAGVYMFDALSGDLLWWASSNASATSAADADSGVIALKDSNLKYSVVSEIKTADRDNDGLVDHLYFGDLAGQVFRIDLDNTATKLGAFAKRSVRLMNLHTSGGTSPRFYEAPAFSIYRNIDGSLFATISIGSGNRSRPLMTYPLNTAGRDYDAIYNIYDKDVTSRTLYNATTMVTENVGLAGSSKPLVEITDSDRFNNTTIKAPYITAGWYYKFKAGNLLQSEKVLDTPMVINNDMYVMTYDQSKSGSTLGPCGGGVKGESMLTAFCMPYGQCASGTVANYQLNLGVGIVGAAIGAGDTSGLSRVIVANIDTSKLSGAADNKILNAKYSTTIRLTPMRWYER